MGYSWMPSGKTQGTLSEHEKGLSTYAESPTGGLDGDRTHDLLFRRQTLYPLSYKPVRQPTLHCLEMKATLFTEKMVFESQSLCWQNKRGWGFGNAPNYVGDLTGAERGTKSITS